MIGGGRIQTRGERFFSSMIGNAQDGIHQQILSPETVQALGPARRNVRSRHISHEFSLAAGAQDEFLFLAPDGWALAISGIITDHDGGAAPAPLLQIEYPNTNHPPLGWAQAGDSAFVGSAALSTESHGQIFEEPNDYFRMVAPTQAIQINARRHPADVAGTRRFNVVLVCWEIARSWN